MCQINPYTAFAPRIAAHPLKSQIEQGVFSHVAFWVCVLLAILFVHALVSLTRNKTPERVTGLRVRTAVFGILLFFSVFSGISSMGMSCAYDANYMSSGEFVQKLEAGDYFEHVYFLPQGALDISRSGYAFACTDEECEQKLQVEHEGKLLKYVGPDTLEALLFTCEQDHLVHTVVGQDIQRAYYDHTLLVPDCTNDAKNKTYWGARLYQQQGYYLTLEHNYERPPYNGSDHTDPEVKITNPESYAIVRGTIPVYIAIQDDGTISSVSASASGGTYDERFGADLYYGKETSISTNWDTTKLPDGKYAMKVYVLDSGENRVETSATVYIDNARKVVERTPLVFDITATVYGTPNGPLFAGVHAGDIAHLRLAYYLDGPSSKDSNIAMYEFGKLDTNALQVSVSNKTYSGDLVTTIQVVDNGYSGDMISINARNDSDDLSSLFLGLQLIGNNNTISSTDLPASWNPSQWYSRTVFLYTIKKPMGSGLDETLYATITNITRVE